MGWSSSSGDTVRSAVVPGWGQWSQGRRSTAWAVLAGTVLLPAAFIAVGVSDPSRVAEWLLTPSWLYLLLLVNVVVAGVRSWGVWDAWEEGAGRRRTWVLALALVFVVLPHGGLGWLQVRTATALDEVFSASTTTTTTTTTTTASPTTPTPTTSTPGANPTLPPPITIPTTTAPDGPPWGNHLTVLLLGGDGGVGRSGTRTDAMILVDIDSGSGRIALFSLPRNLRGFPFEEAPAFDSILNAVYGYGTDHPDLFDSPWSGAAAITSVAEQISGLDIDYFALMDFYAFVDMVDALGGVTIDVPHDILFPEYRYEDGTYGPITIPPGVRELTGDEALAFVRSRKVGSDYGRMNRQRCLVTALLGQVKVPSLVLGLPSLITSFEERVITNIPLEYLPEMVLLATSTDVSEATMTTFGPPLWHAGWVEGGWPIPDVERIQDAIRQVRAGDPSVLGTPETFEAGITCALP